MTYIPADTEKVSTRVVRPAFMEGLERICLTLGLGHFLCVPLLHLVMWNAASEMPAFYRYASIVTLTGLTLLVIAFLFRYESLHEKLPYLCFGVLFLQAALFVYDQQSLFHPVSATFPLLVSLAAPVLGKKRSYALAWISCFLFLGYAAIFAWKARVEFVSYVPALCLLSLIFFLSAYLAETLWFEILTREAKLKLALRELAKKATEMERWVHQLGRASRLISAGDYSAALPKPPPHEVFQELTQSVSQMQEKLQQYFSDLLLKNRMSSLGVLAMGIAHELNTPLTTLEFVLQGDNAIPGETKERIKKELNQLANIAKGLLSLAWEKSEGSFDLNSVVRSSEGYFRYMKRDNVRVHIDLSPGALSVSGAVPQFQQVMVNLFQNALDALEGKEEQDIWITTEKRIDSVAVLTIQDNGCGMAKETLAHALEPFFTTRPGRGTGLGLFVVHQIIRSQGNVIEIESELGKGTTVRIFMPLQQGAVSIEPHREAA